MGVKHTKGPLKRFRHFLPERLRGRRQGRASTTVLNEEAIEVNITAAATIVISSNDTEKEREDIINSFFDDINDMSGKKILAIAVAYD